MAAVDLPHLRFWMVGGETAPSVVVKTVLTRIAQLGLSQRLRWFPRVNHEDMPRFFSAVARSGGVSVITSRAESFGMSAVEAMLCGCPVVAPRVGALPELTDVPDALRFFPEHDLEAGCVQVVRALQHPDQRRTGMERARAELRARWSPGIAQERLEAVLAQARVR